MLGPWQSAGFRKRSYPTVIGCPTGVIGLAICSSNSDKRKLFPPQGISCLHHKL